MKTFKTIINEIESPKFESKNELRLWVEDNPAIPEETEYSIDVEYSGKISTPCTYTVYGNINCDETDQYIDWLENEFSQYFDNFEIVDKTNISGSTPGGLDGEFDEEEFIEIVGTTPEEFEKSLWDSYCMEF